VDLLLCKVQMVEVMTVVVPYFMAHWAFEITVIWM
jgi:hypothetical protein